MTITRVSLVGFTLTGDEKQALAADLIARFSEVEVGNTDPAAHVGFLVQFESLAADDAYVGPAPMVDSGDGSRAVVVTTQVMAGPWNDEMKTDVFAYLQREIRRHCDMPETGSGGDLWMTITETPEGAWGYGGQPVSIDALAPLFPADRQARIAAYLAERSAAD
ncbi:MAG: hypothetical protein P8J50_11680 [Acidimicrobiales bacterium]|jgi:hypothetical protein|nr:hypothetical protein [Acidimicrobiales bacterium]